MFKLILSLLFITFISMAYGQALQTGTWSSMIVGGSGCQNSITTNYTLSQAPTGYQMVFQNSKNNLRNVTVATDGSFLGVASLWYVNGGAFAGYTSVKGMVYNQYSFQAILLPSNGFKGETYYYNFAGCPTSTLLKGAEDEISGIYF